MRLAGLAGAVTLAGCATASPRPSEPLASVSDPGRASVIGEAVTQPFADLNLTGDDPAAPLQAAEGRPYDRPRSCGAANREIAQLDGLLRPADPEAGPAERLGAAAVRSVVRLPFRGVVREITGASARDRAKTAADRAGLLRRGYLQGWRDLACSPPQVASRNEEAWK